METQEVGGANEETTKVGDEVVKEEKKFVDEKDHQRALNDMMRFKKKAQENESKYRQIEETLKSKETEDMKKTSMFKELAEKYEEENKFLKESLKKKDESYITTQKFNALYKAAVDVGLRKEAESDLEFLPLEDVEAEYTSNGRIIVRGADDYIKKIKSLKPHWFNDTSSVKFNGGGTSNNKIDDEITPQMLAKLRHSDPKKHREALDKYLKQAKNTGE